MGRGRERDCESADCENLEMADCRDVLFPPIDGYGLTVLLINVCARGG